MTGEQVTRHAPAPPSWRLSPACRAGGAVVLAYHDISADPQYANAYSVTPRRFRAHLRLLRATGYQVVALTDIVQRLRAGHPVDGMAAVVFDDGLVGVFRHAVPALVDAGMPATVFALTHGLGARPPWWPGSNRLMTTGELAEVVAAGLTLGSHTCSHPSLPALPPGELSREVGDSRDALEQCARRPITLFAYPFGHHSRRVRAAVAAAGYDVAFTFLNGRVDLAADRFRLPRLTMTGRHGLARLTYHLYRRGTSWPDHQLEEVTGGDP